MAKETILLVDDQTENISVLYSFLSQFDYKLLIAEEGKVALDIANQVHPDLILLDVMMPGMSGFEVCKKLKQDPELANVPVIFMTALTELKDKIEGFNVGGVDYITKPLQHEETLARVRTHLTISRQHKALQQKNQELDAFAHTVAHDLKNPLNGISGRAELIKLAADKGDIDKVKEFAASIYSMGHKASDIIEALLLLAGTSRHQQLSLEPFDMKYVIPKVQERLQFSLQEVQANLQFPDNWPFAVGHIPWVEEVWINYISNALKYGGTPPQIELGFDPPDTRHNRIRFWVRDNGPGLSPEQQARLFVPFTRLHKDRASGHGLGLTIVQRIIEKLGGEVGVDSREGKGSLFYFTLPVKLEN